MKIYNSIAELTGNTPLIEVHHLEEKFHLQAHLLVKTESFNPAGSVKDRIARRMIEDAEKEGILKKGTTIIEPTSGNTGIGLSMVATVKGYRIIIVMPSTMSPERVKLMKAYGAEVVLSDGAKGMKGAIAKADELHAEIKDSWIPGQFVNPSNWKAHYDTTGPEIWKDTDGTVDIFIAGIGTGGTITGTGKYLKEKKPSVKVVAVEPSASAVLNGKPAGPHKIQGIGAGFIPDVLDTSIYDEIQDVDNEKAFEYGRMLGTTEGILAGISSGAALYAGIEEAKKPENKGKTIVVLLPDSGDRYLSTTLFAD
ncbi:MAG: cysteine synthase A [Stecheria intestinalis]|jgi:cysteine synthase A|uniref:cysteine synthase A n=1 Tax=Stecheria intestinalis TaxID=2606630 RepID=UPI0023F0CAA3|nr:cysteine synthase A [Stecheria intestinalis]MCI2153972.1 cysteine synthase A [Solobacterium sp.]MCI6745816.1 cysteine synthase A [Anaerolactibacter massiliensis]MDY3234472.1 cysteine synthase A [Erysipelotrichaceae bacterium]MDY4682381.1 cysteine synthase A [Lachnospiraceae bacterium]MDD5880853.1 cysteine synthase A [Stecheria intestinalis]